MTEAETRIKEHLTRQPAAGYFMTQAILVQEAALKSLDEQNKQLTQQVQRLQAELQSAKAQSAASAPSGGGGFLSSIFGGGSSRPVRGPRWRRKWALTARVSKTDEAPPPIKPASMASPKMTGARKRIFCRRGALILNWVGMALNSRLEWRDRRPFFLRFR